MATFAPKLFAMAQDVDKMKKLLNENHEWPSVFMFKFVVPTDNEKLALVQAMFNSHTAEIRQKQSSKGNYTSVTIREVMISAQAVIDVYEEARQIDGLIAL